MEELLLRKKLLPLCTKIIEGAKANNVLFDLVFNANAAGNIDLVDSFLANCKFNDETIETYSKVYQECEAFLQAAGVDIDYEIDLEMTRKEWEQKLAWEKKFCYPYRWRVPLWIREPIQRLFNIKSKE